MAKLKKIITQISIDERKAYGRNEETYTRHASLLASSNNPKVLNDPTGSRRFITFLVNTINDAFTIDYLQLYAQIKHLIDSGFRFWFNIEEIEELDNHNDKFRSRSPEEEFLFVYFRKPLPGESCRSLLASEILKRISEKTGLKITSSGINLLGKVLNKHGFETKRKSKGDVYAIYELDLNEVEQNSKMVVNEHQVVVNEPLITEPELLF